MSGSGQALAPVRDMRTNVLRQRKVAAATRAEAGPGNLAPNGGNPLSTVLSTLETAWVSSSETRTHFAETLVGAGSAVPGAGSAVPGAGSAVPGAGSAVPGAFGSHAAACRSAAAGEPVEVDHDDPDDGWKADASRIDARITGMLQNPYRSGGY